MLFRYSWLNKRKFWSSIISLGLLLSLASSVKATEMSDRHSGQNQFRRIEQPLSLKVAVTLSGLGLIAAELWWFLGSNNPVQRNTNNQNSPKNLS